MTTYTLGLVNIQHSMEWFRFNPAHCLLPDSTTLETENWALEELSNQLRISQL